MFAASSSACLGSSSPGLTKKPGAANDSPLLVHRKRHMNSQQLDDAEMNNVVTMVCFATALMENLARINRGKFVRLPANIIIYIFMLASFIYATSIISKSRIS